MWRVLLAERLNDDAEQRLAAAAEVVRPSAGDEDTLAALIAGVDALVVRTHTRVTRRLLAAGRRLRVVGVAGVGLDNVDEVAAAEHGITVLNRPAAATASVAELTTALILLALRPIPQLAAAYRSGDFRAARAAPHGPELRGRTVGILGMGRIGSAVGRICAAGLGTRVIYHDIAPVGPFGFPATAVDPATLWAESDILTLHVPLTPLTRGLISRDVLAACRRRPVLINTARGAIVDTPALVAALAAGQIAAAGLDVTDPEPLPPDHPLWQAPNVTITPHIASRTHEGLARMCAIVDDVLAFLAAGEGGQSPAQPV
jgi:phosphoglycerate dehydrogenase-like enzyme